MLSTLWETDLDKWEFTLCLCNKLSQDLALLNAHLIFHGSGIRTGHNRDRLPLIHDAWMTWNLGAAIIWRFLCLHVWQSMLPELKTLVGCNSWGSRHLTLSFRGLYLVSILACMLWEQVEAVRLFLIQSYQKVSSATYCLLELIQ